MASRERCPNCGSFDITGRAYDLAGGDEYQERYCYRCQHGEDRLRSQGGVSWYVEVPPQEPHRMFAATGVERTLLGEIYAAPDDDGPRAVYADWLIERGDPLGTFISLQLARAARRDPIASDEEQRLLDAHWSAWIGAPTIAIGAKAVAFERGLWASCGAFAARVFGEDLAHAAAWGTVRELHVGRAFGRAHLATLLAGPIRRSLRRVHVLERSALAALATTPPLAVEALVMELDTSRDPPSLTALRGGLPALRTVDLPCHGEFAPRWIERADEAGLDHLILAPSWQMLLDMPDLMRAAKRSRLARLSLRVHPAFTFHLDRDVAGGGLAIRAVELHPRDKPHDAIVAAKKRLDELARYVDPGVKMTMQTITPALAAFAEQRGVKLIRAATSFAARPRA